MSLYFLCPLVVLLFLLVMFGLYMLNKETGDDNWGNDNSLAKRLMRYRQIQKD